MDFKERFKGRISTMNKDGVMGIVANQAKPIEKLDNQNQPTMTNSVNQKMSKQYYSFLILRPKKNSKSHFPSKV